MLESRQREIKKELRCEISIEKAYIIHSVNDGRPERG